MTDFEQLVIRQNKHRNRTLLMDRSDWTREQWIDDVRDVMIDPDGSVRSLLDGHVHALLAEIDDLRQRG